MAIEQVKDIENGGDLEKPLIKATNNTRIYNCEDEESEVETSEGSISMVLISTAVAVCGSFEFGSCVGYSSTTQAEIRNDLHISLAEFSMFGSIVTIGAMIGAITSGQISDFIGRKGAMRLSAVFCIIGWLAVYFSMGALLLDIGRFLTGYGIGIFSYVVPVFIAEIAPKNLRGGLTTLNQLMIVTGGSFSLLMGTFISWRSLALIGIFPCIFLLLGLLFIPESPRWLAKIGHEKEFEIALSKLRGKDADVSRESAEIQAYNEILQTLPRAGLVDLLDHKYIRSVIIAVGLMVFQQFIGINGVGFYASQTLVDAGLPSADIGIIVFAISQVPATMVGAILMDKTGRRPLLLVSAIGTLLGCLLTASSFFLKGQDLLLEWIPILAVSGLLIYILAFSIGLGGVPWLIMSEIFPIHVKGVAGSLVVLVNWSGAWAVSYTFNFLMSWSSTGTFLIYSGFCTLTILFVAKVVPETKGKTLEEIQASINSKN